MGDEADYRINRMIDRELHAGSTNRWYRKRQKISPADELPQVDDEPKTVACSYCLKPGLHWTPYNGSYRLREPEGFVHDCGRADVTISLPTLDDLLKK